MATGTVMRREREEESAQMSHSVHVSSQTKRTTFTSSDEDASHPQFCPIISADVMSVKEILDMSDVPRHRTWEILRQTDEEYHRDQWTRFGNEAEKMELSQIRCQRLMRTRVDRKALRTKAEAKASAHIKYLELLSQKAPDFPVPLRSHTVWEGMRVVLCCTVQGCPPPGYKDGVLLKRPEQPWNYGLMQTHGLNTLEIRRCSPEDGGRYKVLAQSPLGEATTFATLVVNSYQGAVAGSESWQTPGSYLDDEAHFGTCFPPTWVKEGSTLSLRCDFTAVLLPYQQEVSWFRDGVRLLPSDNVDIRTVDNEACISLKAAFKEHEGFYTVRLKTWDSSEEHRAFVYITDASAAVRGAPASPLSVQVSDVNRDYVFLTWQPPSADGDSPVEGYYVERCDLSEGEWVRCQAQPQRMCHLPVFGLKDGAVYQFRVRAVNKVGAGRPSKATEPVRTADPLLHTRTMVVKVDKGRSITVTKDQLEAQLTSPLPPTNVRACEVSDTYVVLSWTEPEPRGAEPLSFYVERSLVGRDSWELASLDQEVRSPRFPVLDLVRGKHYLFRVRSVNKHGVSEPSLPSLPISLGKAQAPPPPPRSVLPVRDSDSSVQLLWQEPEDTLGILGYYLYYSETGSPDWKTVNNKPLTCTRFTVHGLKKGSEYVFRVKSVSRAGNSHYSDESEPIVVKAAIRVPSAPSAIALLLCTGSEMVLGWRAPSHTGGSRVRGYYLDQRETGLSTWREVNAEAVTERKLKVCHLTSGDSYQFRVFAANMAGVGKPSEPSADFLCEKWTMPQPGCPYDLEVKEVRDDSMVLVWEAPLYEGRGPVTGYFLEVSEGDQSEEWTTVSEQPITDEKYKVLGLQAGQTYRFRVSAVNEAGTGSASLPTEPVTAETKAGTTEIEIGVDDDGFIFLGYENEEVDEESEVVWRRDYKEPVDPERAQTDTSNNKSVLTFNDAAEEDLGLYTVEVADNPDLSSSYDFTADDLERLKELSWQIRNPLIGLRSGWQVDVSEKGEVRLWLQTESLSDEAELRLIFNDQEISSSPHRQIKLDRAKGLVEILFDRLSPEDEGSYTAQLRDGRAKNQFTLVFVDQKFRDTLALANTNRREYERKSGPYFQEFLSWSINQDCELVIKSKVTNTIKETSLRWMKGGAEVKQVVHDPSTGVSSLTITQVTKEVSASYRAAVSDKRGEDVSTLDLRDQEYEELLQQLSKQCALSAGPLSIESTAVGFKLYCSLKYYTEHLKTTWNFRDKKMEPGARTRSGSNTHMVWLEIFNPTENDKGKYSLEMFDGKETHKRSLDLSGQAFADALREHQRLKEAAIAEKNRAKVIKGLPDMVAIQEDKSLCLTCFIEGDPAPEVLWLHNEREIVGQAQFTITKEPKCSSITINDVKMGNSGKYSIVVRNKYGSETVDVMLSVYKHGDMPPANAVEMGF